MATAERRLRPRFVPVAFVPVAFVAALAIALVIGLVVTSDKATAPSGSTEMTVAAVAVEATSIYQFATLAEMVEASDVIAVGTVIATEPGRLVGDPANGGVISRIITIEVDQSLRGDASIGAGSTIVIEEEATLADGTPLVVNGVPGSEVDDRGIWFLDQLDDAELPVYLVINSQGRFLTPGDDPGGDLIGGDQRDPLVQQLQQQPLADLVTATQAALADG